MLPSDKTKTFVILPEEILLAELNIHLQDTETYDIISEDKYQQIFDTQLKAVQDAIRFYQNPKLLPDKPSIRYIYFLPKTHKELADWRTHLHPKMRPIVSDTNSVTCKLAKHILPLLQILEAKIESTITSSLSVAYNIENRNAYNSPTRSTQMAVSRQSGILFDPKYSERGGYLMMGKGFPIQSIIICNFSNPMDIVNSSGGMFLNFYCQSRKIHIVGPQVFHYAFFVNTRSPRWI
jgi:hypothetical protein